MSDGLNRPALFAKIVPEEGAFDEVLERLTMLVPSVEENPGITVYRIHVTDDRSAIWFYEEYADAGAQQAHRESERVREVFASCSGLIATAETLTGVVVSQK